MAFGAAGSAGAQIELGDAEKTARGLLEDGKTTLVWNLPARVDAQNRVKLLMNMLMSLRRHPARRHTDSRSGPRRGGGAGFAVRASGLNARSRRHRGLVSGSPGQAVDAHVIQPSTPDLGPGLRARPFRR